MNDVIAFVLNTRNTLGINVCVYVQDGFMMGVGKDYCIILFIMTLGGKLKESLENIPKIKDQKNLPIRNRIKAESIFCWSERNDLISGKGKRVGRSRNGTLASLCVCGCVRVCVCVCVSHSVVSDA